MIERLKQQPFKLLFAYVALGFGRCDGASATQNKTGAHVVVPRWGKAPMRSGGLFAVWAADEPTVRCAYQTRMEKGKTVKGADGKKGRRLFRLPFSVCCLQIPLCQSLIQTPMSNTDVLQRR